MNSYNGFAPDQRRRALAWLNREYAAGRRTRPIRCEACGQDRGPIDAHSENYGEPFGPHIGGFAVCYRCHMALHCRFRNPLAWDRYKADIRAGKIFHPIGRNFGTFTEETLNRFGHGVPFAQGEPKARTFLDGLLMEGPHVARLRAAVAAP